MNAGSGNKKTTNLGEKKKFQKKSKKICIKDKKTAKKPRNF